MAYRELREVEIRLADATPLTEQEIRDMMPYLKMLGEGLLRRFEGEVALANIHAIREFNKSSTKQGRVNLLLNTALFGLTVVAIVIALKSYHAANQSTRQQQMTLEATRNAVEKSAASLQTLAGTVQDQWKRQLEREARQPAVEVSVRITSPDGSLREVKLSEKKAKLQASNRTPYISFVLRNIGNAPVFRPAYVIIARPDHVLVSCGGAIPEGLPTASPNGCQLRDLEPIYPLTQNKLPRSFDLNFMNFLPAKTVELDFNLTGENISTQTYRLQLEFIQTVHPP